MSKSEMKSSGALQSGDMLQTLLDQASLEFNLSGKIPPILQWAQGLRITGGDFDLANHPWQREILESTCSHIVLRTAAQLGKTTVFILKILHSLLSGRYPQGFIVAMPTEDSALNYSKSRFGPLIQDNTKIKALVNTTDSASLKRVHKSYISFVGSQLTTPIADGMKRTSTALVSTPADGYLVDEVDRVPPRALDLLSERLSHSKVKDEFFVSTPTIPDYAIDALYQQTDQRTWQIKCTACGEYTCLETEFPSCLQQMPDGRTIRVCKKCHKEISLSNGIWVPAYPSKSDKHGYWISQLNSPFVDPGKILKAYQDGNNPSEFYNSKLGLPYIEAENRLTASDIYACCDQELMAASSQGPAAIGLDIGKLIHCVVAIRTNEHTLKVVYLARVSSFQDVSDICARYGVRCAISDAEPETRAVREWQQSMRFPVYLCDYTGATTGPAWNEPERKLRVNRTEALDQVHHTLTTPGKIILPRRNSEVEEFVKECTNTARMIEEDSFGGRRFVWRKLGADHYFHALAYCLLAAQRIPVFVPNDSRSWALRHLQSLQDGQQPYNPLTHGLNITVN